jgi:hypothetical protein
MAQAMGDLEYPDAVDASLVGTFSALARSGGGYVWDAVLEYRVWCHPERGAPNLWMATITIKHSVLMPRR